MLVSAFKKGGEMSLGYRQQSMKTSMKSKGLPKSLVSELELKSEMEKHWKTLSSSSDASCEAVASAESAFRDQAVVVDAMFDSRSLFLRSKDVKKCSGKTPGARKNFWGAVTGKVKQSLDISAVLSSSGVLKCGNDEICAEVETHLCDVFQGSI